MSDVLASSTPLQLGQSTFHDMSEQADLAGLQERRNRPLFVEPFVAGKVEHVDARQLAIGRIAHQSFKRGDAIGISRLPQDCKQ